MKAPSANANVSHGSCWRTLGASRRREHLVPVVSAIADVINRARERQPQPPRHERELAAAAPSRRAIISFLEA